jgi:hypothetical protein
LEPGDPGSLAASLDLSARAATASVPPRAATASVPPRAGTESVPSRAAKRGVAQKTQNEQIRKQGAAKRYRHRMKPPNSHQQAHLDQKASAGTR